MIRAAFYYEDGNGHAIKIRRWLSSRIPHEQSITAARMRA